MQSAVQPQKALKSAKFIAESRLSTLLYVYIFTSKVHITAHIAQYNTMHLSRALKKISQLP